MKENTQYINKKPHKVKDYQGDTLWKKATGEAFTCNYFPELHDEDTDVPTPNPFYHDWNEGSKSWIENKDKKRKYLISVLNIEYESKKGSILSSLSVAMANNNEELIKELRAEFIELNKWYDEEMKKILNDTIKRIQNYPVKKRCPKCAAVMEDKGEYWQCTKCSYREYK